MLRYLRTGFLNEFAGSSVVMTDRGFKKIETFLNGKSVV